ncbi:MAG: hypothetical protein FWH07_00915 [Oscillospiraceae bacterium]|nr:hypothetical protein [Oscillospiraceae bacterium]
MNEFTEKQLKDLDYFSANVAQFFKDNSLRFRHIIISDAKIVKSFDALDKAVDYAVQNLKKGEYIIEQVINEDEIVNFV